MEYGRTVERFVSLTADPRRAQAQTLARIVGAARSSPFGRHHELSAVEDVASFRRAVPIQGYEGFRPWIERDPSALTNEAPLALLRTSASTGKPKHIPYTPAFREAIRAAHDVFSAAMFRDYPWLPLVDGQTPRGIGLYQLTAGASEVAGVPLDSYVSRLYDVALPEDPFFFALPRSLCQISDARLRLYAMALRAASWDVRALRATNPTTLLLFARLLGESTAELLDDLARGQAVSAPTIAPVVDPLITPQPELAKRLAALGRPLVPRDLWPNLDLLVTWRGGTCDLYRPYLLEHFGDVRIRAPIFAASEGVIAVPLDDDMRGGVPALESTFLEFRPLGSSDVLGVEELVDGQRYELILSSPSGLLRYLIGDIVEVDGRVGACPTITFVARNGRTSSLTGEKLTELQVEGAVVQASRRLGVSPRHFLLSAQFDALPYYVLSLEWGEALPPRHVASRFAILIDEILGEANVEYRSKRDSDRLGPVTVQEVEHGQFERLQAAGLSGSQAANFKLPHLSAEALHERLEKLRR